MPVCVPKCTKVKENLRKALKEGEITAALKGHLKDTNSATSRKHAGTSYEEEDGKASRATDSETSARISKDSSTGTSSSSVLYSDSRSREKGVIPRSSSHRDGLSEGSRVRDSEFENNVDEIDDNWPRQVCEKTCPLKILKERIKRKLEYQQRIIDQYLLTKGFHYFDNVCTCTLSCVYHSLTRDSFVRNLLASTALFALGMKLCYEMNHWYLPVRF